MKKIGLLGGTFDPPHVGHLMIANEVLDQMNLDEIWFIPTNEPPHKKSAQSSNEHRKNMLDLAIQDNKRFRVQTIEFDRLGKSYTIDTIRELQTMYNYTFYFIIGADMIEYLPKWHRIDELMNMIEFIGVKRTNYKEDTPYPLTLLQIPIIDISSTDIRQRIHHHRTVKYLVQDNVYAYMKEHHLYGL